MTEPNHASAERKPPEQLPPGTLSAGLTVPLRLPDQWLRTLALIQWEFPKAILAGGALRDLLLARPVKDLDIVVPLADRYNELTMQEAILLVNDRVERLANTMNCQWASMTGGDPEKLAGYQENMGGVVHDVFEFTELPPAYEYEAKTVQIIVLGGRYEDCNLKAVADRCDFGFCQISTDGSYLHMSEAFLEDVQKQEINARNPHSVEESWKRWTFRLREKYPTWKLVGKVLEFDNSTQMEL